MEQNDKDDGAQFRRALVLFAAILGVVALVAGLIIWSPWKYLGGDDDSNVDVQKFTLLDEDKTEIKRSAEDIVEQSSNFGLDDSQVTNNNLHDISYTVSRQDAGWTDYVDTRAESYESFRDMIVRGSPVDYSRAEVSAWETGDELDNLKSFVLNSSTVNVNNEGTIEKAGSEDARYVRVPVTFDSTVTQRLVTAEDTSWDGSYRILQKDMQGSATLVFREYAGEWLLYNVESPKNLFLTTLWEPNFNEEYTSKMYDFKEVEIVTPDEPYETKNEGAK